MKKATGSIGLFRRMLSTVLAVCVVGQAVPAGAVALERGAAAGEETLESLPSMVMGELEDRRTATSKSFRMSDGTVLVADYGMPVHYQEGEQWIELDNTLMAEPAGAEGGFDGFVTKDGLGSVKFGADLSGGTIFGMENEGYGLRVKLPSAEVRAKIESAKAGGKSEADDKQKEEDKSPSSEPPSSSSQSSASESSSSGSKPSSSNSQSSASQSSSSNSEAQSSSSPESEPVSSALESSSSTASGSGAPGEGASSAAGTSLQAQSSEASSSSSSPGGEPSSEASSSGTSSPSSSEASKERKETETEPPKPLKSVKAELIDVKAEAEAELSESRAAEKATFDEKYKAASAALRSVLDRTKAIEEHNDKQTRLKTQTGGVRYLGGYDGADLEYYASGNTVKENIVVHGPQEAYSYTFELELQGLQPNALDDGRIQLLNDKGEEVYIIQAPILIDADGALGFDARNEITEIDGKVYLTVTAGKEWFEEEGRAFPVKIDPTLQFTLGVHLGQVANASVFEWGMAPRRNDQFIIAGRLPADIGRARGYLKFAIPQFQRGAAIVSAELLLSAHECYQYPNNYPGAIYPYNNLNIAAMTLPAAWYSDTITWANQPANPNQAIASTLPVNDVQNYYVSSSRHVRYNITKAVQAWSHGTQGNFGLVFSNVGEFDNYFKYMYFTSDVYLGGNPVLFITYRETVGTESYWNGYGHGLANAGAGAVTLCSGNLVYTLPVFSDSGNRMPLSFSLAYNSLVDLSGMPLRAGNWRTNYSQYVIPTTGQDYAAGYRYVYIDGDGTPHYFYIDSTSGKCVDEDGLGLEITVSGGERILTSKSGSKLYFTDDASGNIKRAVDPNGNAITVTYNSSTLVTFGYGNGRTATVQKDGSGNVTGFTDCYGQTVTFSYTSGRLSGVTYPDGRTVQVTYGDVGGRLMINKIENHAGDQLLYGYDVNTKKVTSIEEKAKQPGGALEQGQKVSFDYARPNSTAVRSSGPDDIFNNEDDLITRYIFDNWGRTFSMYVADAGETVVYAASNQELTADSYKTTNDGANPLKRNKVQMASGNVLSNLNLLSNGSFETAPAMTQSDVATGASYSGLVSQTGTQKYYGTNSAKFIYSGDNSKSPAAHNSLTLPAGDYTLSAYVKTENVIAKDGEPDQGFGLVAFWTGNTVWSNALRGSSAVTFSVDSTSGATGSGTGYESANNTLNGDLVSGWRRLQVNFKLEAAATVSVGFGLRQATGTAYVDGLKLEKSDSASPFNLLENPSFENNNGSSFPNSWTLESGSAGNDISRNYLVSAGDTLMQHGPYGFRFSPSVGRSALLGQVYTCNNFQAGDVFSFSGWAKANAAPKTYANPTRAFALNAVVFYSTGDPEFFTVPFNSYYADWQYVSGTAVIRSDRTPTSIQLRIDWFDQPGYALFDDIALVREDGQSYTYDANGNVQRIADINGQQIGAVYNALNLVTEFTDTLGNKTTYTYDDYKLKTTTSPMGLKTELGYAQDSGGVATSAKVTSNGSDLGSSYTKLLLHFDNNTNDNSDYNNTISGLPNGYNSNNAVYGQSANFTGWNIWIPKTADTTFGDKDFTVDWWEYNYSLPGDSAVANMGGESAYSMLLGYQWGGASNIAISNSGTGWTTSMTMGVREINKWDHYAITRSGNTIRTFKNGVVQATNTFTGSVYQNANAVIGSGWNNVRMNGALDDFRVTIGKALWTTNFTPNGNPAGIMTKLLLHFDGNSNDSSVYNHAVNGWPAGYGAPAKFGSAANFNNNWIWYNKTSALTFGNSDFTMDWWEYNNTTGSDYYNSASGNIGGMSGYSLLFSYCFDGRLYMSNNGSSWMIDAMPMGKVISAWTHHAIVRQGNTIYTFKNGSLIATRTFTGSLYQNGALTLGGGWSNTYMNGYLDEFRVLIGKALWTSNFTPPTTAYTGLENYPSATPPSSTYKSYESLPTLYSSTEFLDNYNYAYRATDSLGNVSKTYYRVYDPDYTDSNGRHILPDSLTAAPYSTANSGAPGYTDPNPGNNKILGQVAVTEAPDGSKVFYTYDPTTLQLTGISKAVGAGEAAVNYVYDSKYRLSEIQHNSFSYLFSYDAFGNTTQIAIQEGEDIRVLTTNTYAANNGRLLRSTYGNGNYVETEIDELGRTKEKKVNGAVTASYGYDMQGNVTWEKDHLTGITWTYTYDLSGALTRASNSEGFDKTYRRDLGGNLVAETTALGGETRQTGYTYDKDQKPVLQKILGAAAGELQSENTYDGLGRIKTKTWRSKADDQTVSQTKLLLHFDGNTTDSSDFSHTVSGNPNSYNSANAIYGQAARFNGNTITIPKTAETTFGDKDFTVDWWEYNYALTTYESAVCNVSGVNVCSMMLNCHADGRLYMSSNGTSWQTELSMGGRETNVWTHYAVTRSGNTIRIFKNGVQKATGTFTGSVYQPDNFVIGTGWGTTPMNGLLDDFRVTIGKALWTGNFTPNGSAPSLSVSLLMHGDSMADSSEPPKTIVSAGTAYIDTSRVKFGTGSLRGFTPNVGITLQDNEAFDFDSGNFTVEGWIYMVNPTQWQPIFDRRSAEATGYLVCYQPSGSTGHLSFISSSVAGTWNTVIHSDANIPMNTWTHFAYTRQGNTWRCFINGQLHREINTANSILNVDRNPLIGTTIMNYGQYFAGNIDELRIIKGEAKYTANFTPSTTAYTLDARPATPVSSTYKSYGTVPGETLTELTANYTYTPGVGGPAAASTQISGVVYKLGGVFQLAHRYTYDELGNIVKVEEKTSETGSYADLNRYEYDDLGQLIRHDDIAAERTVVYTYDNAGNILSEEIYALTAESVDPTGTPQNQQNWGYEDPVWKDLLTSFTDADDNTTSFTYDEIGNPLNWTKDSTLTWQNGRQLASYSQNIGESSITTEYTYNAAGQRIAKQTGESVTQYIYDGSKLFKEIRPDGSYQLYYYDIAGQLFAFDYVNGETTTRYFYQRNLMSEITGILDANGVLVAQYTYDAWGKILSIKDGQGNDVSGNTGHIANVNPLRYKGYYFDKESGLYFLQTRYYDPGVKRFLNSDAILDGRIFQGLNSIVYSLNNPINLKDTGGMAAVATSTADYEYQQHYVATSTADYEAQRGSSSVKPKVKISNKVVGSNNTIIGTLTIVSTTAHTWLVYEDKNSNTIQSIGTWGNEGGLGVNYNLEMKNYDFSKGIWYSGKYGEAYSLSRDISKEQKAKMDQYVIRNNTWDIYKNCTAFATGAWNSTGLSPISGGRWPMPDMAIESIMSYSDHDINKIFEKRPIQWEGIGSGMVNPYSGLSNASVNLFS